MISFRYHIVTLVAVFLALAVGIVLGAGPLQGAGDVTLADQVESERQATVDLRAEMKALESGNAFTDEFARTVAPILLGDSLRGRSVTLLVLPTAQQADVSALKGFVGIAGGSVAGTVRAGTPLVDVRDKQLVDELGNQLESRATGVRIAADSSPYERMGALIARAIGTDRRGGAPVDDGATSILSGLDTAKVMSVEGELSRRGDLLLFVTGAGPSTVDAQRGASTIVSTLVEAVDAGTAGVVLAGPVESARANGQVKAVRDDVGAARDVSTVDTLGRTAGQVVAVMALAGQGAGETGQFGALDAADGAMPGARAASQ